MPDIAVSVADYLKNPALFTAANSPSGVAWGSSRAVESEIISPFRLKADADAEAVRQAAFLKGPLVEEVATVNGARRDLMLKTITLKSSQLGLSAGVPAFVIGFSERDDGMTDLTIVRSIG